MQSKKPFVKRVLTGLVALRVYILGRKRIVLKGVSRCVCFFSNAKTDVRTPFHRNGLCFDAFAMEYVQMAKWYSGHWERMKLGLELAVLVLNYQSNE